MKWPQKAFCQMQTVIERFYISSSNINTRNAEVGLLTSVHLCGVQSCRKDGDPWCYFNVSCNDVLHFYRFSLPLLVLKLLLYLLNKNDTVSLHQGFGAGKEQDTI